MNTKSLIRLVGIAILFLIAFLPMSGKTLAVLNPQTTIFVHPDVTENGEGFTGSVWASFGSLLRATGLQHQAQPHTIDWTHNLPPNVGYKIQISLEASNTQSAWITQSGNSSPEVGKIVTADKPAEMYLCDDTIFIHNPPFIPRCWFFWNINGGAPYEPYWQHVGSCPASSTCKFDELLIHRANLAVMKTGWDN